MKRFIFLLTTIFICTITHAQTIDIDWLIGNSVYSQSACEYGGDLIVPTAPTKYGYTFNGWVNYTPIEYLESTGTQYIDTGVIFDSGKLKFQSHFYIKSIIAGEHDFIGTLKTGQDSGFCSGIYSRDELFLYSKPTNFNRSIETNIWYDIIGEFYNQTMTLYINNSLIGSGIRNSFYSSENIILFMGGPGYMPLNTHQKLGSVKIWQNDTLVRDFIPVLDPAGTPCMYDKVEGKFYYNAGTGDFIAGPVITE